MKKKADIKKKEAVKAAKGSKTKQVPLKSAAVEAKPAVKEVKHIDVKAKPVVKTAKPALEEAKPAVKEVKLAAHGPSMRPEEVHIAIRKLLDTTNHIQARATELENALDILHQQERCRAVKDLLLALRNSPDGDLLRFDPKAVALDDGNPLKAILEALTETFSVEPVNEMGERIPVRNGEIPDSLGLDRFIGEETGECVAAEVVSVGWKIKEQIIVKPVVRPLFE